MVYCFVPYCPFASPQLRFGANPEEGVDVSFFQPPQGMGEWSEVMFKHWCRKLPRPGFTRESHVCEKHFLDCDIVRYDEVKLKNGRVRRTKLDQPYLYKHACPMIFPNPPAHSRQEKKNTEPPKQITPAVTQPSFAKNVQKDLNPSNASIKSTSAVSSATVKVPCITLSSLPAHSCQEKKITESPKQSTPAVTQQSSIKNVQKDLNPSNAPIKSSSVVNSVPAKVPCTTLSNPPDSTSNSSEKKLRRSLRPRTAVKYFYGKVPKHSDRVIVSMKSPVTTTKAPSTRNAITSSLSTIDSNSKKAQLYDHITLLEDLQKVMMHWPEWCCSDVKQQNEEIILFAHIDPTSGLLDKYLKVKKTDLSVEGFLTSEHSPLLSLPVVVIRNNADILKLLKFMTNLKATSKKK